MAKKIKPEDKPVEVEEVRNLSNVTGFDKEAIKQLMDEVLAKREDIATENKAAGSIYSRMEKEHGVNPKGIKMAIAFAKMSDENRDDVLRSFFLGLEAKGLIPKPDLVDIMEAV